MEKNKIKEEETNAIINKNKADINTKVEQMNTKFNHMLTELNLRIQVCQDTIDKFTVKFKHLVMRTDELDTVQKLIITKNDKLNTKINKQDNFIKEKSDGLRSEMMESISKTSRKQEQQ